MPNPYHDETGQFCSREEMGSAVSRLETRVANAASDTERGEAFDAYFELRKEYEKIKAAIVEVPEAWVGRIANSGLSTVPDTADGIEAYYRSGFSEGVRTGTFHSYGDRTVALLTNPATPRWIANDIYENASIDVKSGAIQRLGRGELHPEITSEDLLPFANGANGTKWEVQQALLSSERISTDAKYDLAARTGNIGSLLSRSSRETELYASIPNIDAALFKEAGDQQLDSRQRSRATNAIAANSKDSAALQLVIAREPANSYAITLVAYNPSLSPEGGVKLLDKVAEEAPGHFAEVYEAEQTKKLGDPEHGRYAEAAYVYAREIEDYRGAVGDDLKHLTDTVSQAQFVLDTEIKAAGPGVDQENQRFLADTLGERKAAEYLRARVKLDAQHEGYAALGRAAKQHQKELKRLRRSGTVFGADGVNHLREHEIIVERRAVARKYRTAQVLLSHLRQSRGL